MLKYAQLLSDTLGPDKPNPGLRTALLEERFGSYFFFRLNYFFLRFFLHCAVFVTEFYILSFIFERNLLNYALLFRVYLSLANGFTWGALEVLRERVRQLAFTGKKLLLEAELLKWLSFSFTVSVVYLMLSAGFFGLMWGLSDEEKLLALYVFSVNLRVGVNIFLRTLHSGAYAISRIFRPAWSILLVELLGFVLTLAFWPLFASFSLPIAVIASSIVFTAISLKFVMDAYARLKLLDRKIGLGELLKFRLPGINFRACFENGFSAACMKFDGLILLFLTQSRLYDFLMLPFIQAAFSWSFLFYFDYKKPEIGCASGYGRLYSRAVNLTSLNLGLLFCAIYLLVDHFLTAGTRALSAGAVTAFFLSRSLLSAVQIRSFCEQQTRGILFTSLSVVAAGYVLNKYTMLSSEGLVLCLSAVMFFSSVLLTLRARAARPDSQALPLSLSVFFERLRKSSGAIYCGYLCLAYNTPQNAQIEIARRLSESLSSGGFSSCLGGREVIWFGWDSAKAPNREELLVMCGGAAERLKLEQSLNPGAAAAFFGAIFGREEPAHPADLCKRFQSYFPKGKILGAGQRHEAIRHYREIVDAAFRYDKSFSPVSIGNGLQVCALTGERGIERIFAIPISAPLKLRKKWCRELKAVNLSRNIHIV